MTLRSVIKNTAGQDVCTCHACNDCDMNIHADMDIPLSSLIQLILLDDEEALHCLTLWSDSVLEESHRACKRGLDLHAIMLALREESKRRNELENVTNHLMKEGNHERRRTACQS